MRPKPLFTALLVVALAACILGTPLVAHELRIPFAAVLAVALGIGWASSLRQAAAALACAAPMLFFLTLVFGTCKCDDHARFAVLPALGLIAGLPLATGLLAWVEQRRADPEIPPAQTSRQ